MRSTSTWLGLAFLAVAAMMSARPVAAHQVDQPLGNSKLTLADSETPAKRRVAFQAAWKGQLEEMPDPTFSGSTLRIIGGSPEEGDTGYIKLVAAAWSTMPKNKGFRYDEPTGSAGGITSILVKLRKKGGSLKIQGGKDNWTYAVRQFSSIGVSLRIGEINFCAQFDRVRTRGSKAVAKAGKAPEQCVCGSGTFQAIQTQIFERRGCTADACHGAAVSGGLDLRPDVAYDNLVGVRSPAYGIMRVSPGGKQDSFLYHKLAAARGEWDLQGRGSPMPSGGAPLTDPEIEAIAKWIHDGAKRDGVVPGTEELLGGCLAPPGPPTIVPPPPPPAATGVQFRAPAWTIQPAGTPAAPGITYGDNGEDEVCYATYYDLLRDGIVPPERTFDCPPFWQSLNNPSGKCFAYDLDELTQEPNSHHSIIHMYRGAFDLATPAQGGATGFDFRCHDGETAGAPCDPRTPGACPAGQECHGTVRSSLACIGFGPPDYSDFGAAAGNGSANSPSVGGSQQPYFRRALADGVFGVFPVQGVIVWNSHAFNIWDEPVQNRQWWNINFIDQNDPNEVKAIVRGIFDATDIFLENVPPFEEREYCRTVTLGKGTRLYYLSSHTHSRGRLFRIFPPPIAESCRSATGTCLPESTEPILVTREYNDPAQVYPSPILALDSDDPAERRVKFCAIYDNGKTDPSKVKRNSRSPAPPQFGNLAPGGPCYYTQIGGRVVDEGIACTNKKDANGAALLCGGNDAVCDGVPGACDACTLRGGVTTEDEMFIMLGSYYCDTSVPGETCTGVCAGGANQGQACHGNDAECPESRCVGYTN